jgi:pyruvate,water dikinase
VRQLSAKGVRVPPGFATTADAYWHSVEANHLKERVAAFLAALASGKATLAETGQAIRDAFLKGEWPADTAAEIVAAYHELPLQRDR